MNRCNNRSLCQECVYTVDDIMMAVGSSAYGYNKFIDIDTFVCRIVLLYRVWDACRI